MNTCGAPAQVEVKVLVLREDLEEQGLERSVIDSKVDAYRTKMVADVDAANEENAREVET